MFSGSRYCLSRKASTPVAENISTILKNEPLLFLYPPAFASAVDNSVELTKTRSPTHNKKQTKARVSRAAEDLPSRRPRWPQSSSDEQPHKANQPHPSIEPIPHDKIQPGSTPEATPQDNIQAPPIVEYGRDDNKMQTSSSQRATPVPNGPKYSIPGLLPELDTSDTPQKDRSLSSGHATICQSAAETIQAKRGGRPGGWIKKSAKGTPLRYTKSMAELDKQSTAANPYAAPISPP
ncbi:hypothetical protein FQN49_002131, partial [Arthroderma sp. PD_2]